MVGIAAPSQLARYQKSNTTTKAAAAVLLLAAPLPIPATQAATIDSNHPSIRDTYIDAHT
jgi:hypothetical protein